METKQIKFVKEKDTKNTVRYQEVVAEGEPPIIGTLYVQKFFAGAATELTITISK